MKLDPLGLGTAPLSSMPGLYGYDVALERAVETVARWWREGNRFIDMANGYGEGRGEAAVGEALRRTMTHRDHLFLATKVDPAPGSQTLDARRVQASVEESLARIGVDHIDVLFLHDPELYVDVETALTKVIPEMRSLVAAGVVGRLGIACGPLDVLARYLESGHFEVGLTHNRYTLLNRSALPLLRRAADLGIAMVNAAPFGGGVLARDVSETTRSETYAYRAISPEEWLRLNELRAIFRAYDVPTAAVALQWSARSPLVASTVVGVSSEAHVVRARQLLEWKIPDELWDEIRDASERCPP